jgi:hypothetical protein
MCVVVSVFGISALGLDPLRCVLSNIFIRGFDSLIFIHRLNKTSGTLWNLYCVHIRGKCLGILSVRPQMLVLNPSFAPMAHDHP